MPRAKLALLFPVVKPGRHTGIKQVSFINCTEFRVEYDGIKIINLDGNLYEMGSPLVFRVLEGAVRFIV
jgi:diacylglycerol kinase family enzyme